MCCPVRCGQTKTAEVRPMPQLQCEEIRFPSADGVHTVAASMYTMPGVPVRAVLQLSHGMCEYVQRYRPMAQWYAQRGIALAGNDHLGHGGTANKGEHGHYGEPRGRYHLLNDLHTMNGMNMLLAVMEKRVGFKLMAKDVFLNIAGGLRVTDPAMDLSVLAAVLSSNVDTAIEQGWCMCGEVGLSGEVRPVSRIEQRIAEAEKLGFQHIIIPKYNYHGFDHKKYQIEIHPVRKVEEAFRCLFG